MGVGMPYVFLKARVEDFAAPGDKKAYCKQIKTH